MNVPDVFLTKISVLIGPCYSDRLFQSDTVQQKNCQVSDYRFHGASGLGGDLSYKLVFLRGI